MTSLSQDVDAIIADENIDNSVLANEEVAPVEGEQTPPENEEKPAEEEQKPEETQQEEEEQKEEKPETPIETPEEKPEAPAEPTKTATETVNESRALLDNLNLSDDKIFDDKGEVVPFTKVVPVGDYLLSQLTPIKVIGKDGKEHEFLLIKDVEDKFPEGFEAKNNLEQLKFEKAIGKNEDTFDTAVNTYKKAEERYTQETNAIIQSRSENERIGKEYRSMADAGLVPKIEGDPNDPKFLESAAVKELNTILEYMDTKNKELASKGLGQINSLYVAKQLMQTEGNKVEKEDKKKAIIDQRNEVASLSSTPSSTEKDKRTPAPYVPMSRLADSIIAEEGLK